MRKLALDDNILLNIEKPARYIGHEVNSVMKDKNAVDIRFAMCFPEVYEVGMSHLGIQILYDMFNRREDTWCERVYSPWIDLDKIMREKHIPLFTLESQDPVKDFDFLGITLQFEMCYTNVLQVLDLSGIPLHSEDRTLEDPFVIGGGHVFTIQSHWLNFSICSISERAKWFMMSFWKHTKSGREPEKAGKNFWKWQQRSREFTFLLFMMSLTKKTARSNLSCQTIRMQRKKSNE